jgi:glucose-6-phosphate isomerase
LADLAVIMGSARSHLAAQAVMDGCCQPYWNEMTRAERGSKPRILFVSNTLDNDLAQSLLQRLATYRGLGENGHEGWSLVLADAGEPALESLALPGTVLEALEASCDGKRSRVAPRCTAITKEGSRLHAMMTERELEDAFEPPPDEAPFQVFSPVGLLPAAILGVNVMELLQGSLSMTQHFQEADLEDNVVMQFAALNHFLATQCGVRHRVLQAWNSGLRAFGSWHRDLVHTCFRNIQNFACQAHTCVACEFDGESTWPANGVTHGSASPNGGGQGEMVLGHDTQVVFHDIVVEEPRFDPLSLPPVRDEGLESRPDEVTTLPKLLRTRMQRADQERWSRGIYSTRLTLPILDELHLGQLFQWMMLAIVVERELGRDDRPDPIR